MLLLEVKDSVVLTYQLMYLFFRIRSITFKRFTAIVEVIELGHMNQESRPYAREVIALATGI